MKNKFSTQWKASKQARKQVKYRTEASLHVKRKLMGAHLSKELRKKYSRRSIPARKNDSVKIMRGSFYGKTGKIDNVDRKNLRISVEGIKRTKKDGTKVNVWFSLSKIEIQELALDDKTRIESLSKLQNINKEKNAS